MALSSATNPVLDGVRVAVSNVVADDSASYLNQIYAPCQSVNVIGITNSENDYVILPLIADVPIGHEIIINNVASSDFQLRTPASSGTKINNVDCDGTGSYPMTNTQILKVIKISNTVGWMAHGYTAIGAVATAVVPEGHSLSPSISPSVSKSPSKSPSVSLSPSISPSVSLSPSISPSVSKSPSLSPSISPSVSVSPSASLSPSSSPSVSPSVSKSPSLSPSA